MFTKLNKARFLDYLRQNDWTEKQIQLLCQEWINYESNGSYNVPKSISITESLEKIRRSAK